MFANLRADEQRVRKLRQRLASVVMIGQEEETGVKQGTKAGLKSGQRGDEVARSYVPTPKS